MSSSLSVILPVHNAQRRLVDRVVALLEIIPDLTPRFDITIVDDGSTDSTVEISRELARRYPQVRLLRHAMRHGRAASVETGLQNTTGDIVFVQDDRASVSPSQLQRLWKMRGDPRLVMAGSRPQGPSETTGIMHRLVKWAATLNATGAVSPPRAGTEMICRSTIEQLGTLNDPISHLAVDGSLRADRQQQNSVAGEGPNFLLRLKDFATRQEA